MNISYDEIRRIHRLEKASNKLVEVEEDFLDVLNDFMLEEKKRYLEGLRELSSSKARDFTNLKKMVEEIFLIREKKLLNKALLCSRTGEMSEDKIALHEKRTLEGLLEVLAGYKSYLNGIFEEPRSGREKTQETIAVTLIKDVPSFVGADMKEYGPFEKNMTVKLPFRVAGLLISRNLAEQE